LRLGEQRRQTDDTFGRDHHTDHEIGSAWGLFFFVDNGVGLAMIFFLLRRLFSLTEKPIMEYGMR